MAVLLESVRVNANGAGNGHNGVATASWSLKIDNQKIFSPKQLFCELLRSNPGKFELADEAFPACESP